MISKLKRRLTLLKVAQSLTHKSSEENYYYSGRIEELEYIIKKLGGKINE